MNRAGFQSWVARARATFLGDGPVAKIDRAWAVLIRPHDPALADLYVRCAEANEAVRAHLTRPM